MLKPRVLMIAYACDPRGGGEHWLGWGWAAAAAQRYEVHLITTPKARESILEACTAAAITPYFVEVPVWLRRLTELARAGWWRKLAWQLRVKSLAFELHQRNPFALVHQTTFHTFRTAFLAAELGVPAIWGPIAGGERVPPGFEAYLGRARVPELSRQLTNRLWLELPAIQRSLRLASTIFVSNHTTLNFLPAHIRPKCEIVPPNALRPEDEKFRPPPARVQNSKFNLLYVGNCVPTRAIGLVLEALKSASLPDCELTVIGSGPALDQWRQRAAELDLAARVRFLGKVPYEQLADFYSSADVLVFPALRDSGGSALLESMARHLPVVCLDWAGPGEMVDETSGIKVPVDNPRKCVEQFAGALIRLKSDSSLRTKLAEGARSRAESLFTWASKQRLLENAYSRLLGA